MVIRISSIRERVQCLQRGRNQFSIYRIRTVHIDASIRVGLRNRITKLQSICGVERVSINTASPASPQLTARSGQSAQFQCTHCIRTHVTCIQTLDTPAAVRASRDRCMISFEERRRYHVHLFTMTLSSPRMDCRDRTPN
jgi:hypothetical protein